MYLRRGATQSPICPTPPAIGSGWLRRSAEAFRLTPPPHQRGVLPQPSHHGYLPPKREGLRGDGRLFLRRASGLDAFSPYPEGRSFGALPYRTAPSPEAPPPRSSRTEGGFLSDGPHPRYIESDLSHDGLNPAHVPL